MNCLAIIISLVAITDDIIEEWKSEEDRVILQKCIPRKPSSVQGTYFTFRYPSSDCRHGWRIVCSFETRTFCFYKGPLLEHQEPCRNSLGVAYVTTNVWYCRVAWALGKLPDISRKHPLWKILPQMNNRLSKLEFQWNTR